MITKSELSKIARARLRDAEVLYAGSRYDGAIYLCGYAVEITLKARSCKTLKWVGFPSTKKDFEGFQSFRTHRLDVLLSLSGQEDKIKSMFLADWSIVAKWDTETRYTPIGTATQKDAFDMIESSKVIIKALR